MSAGTSSTRPSFGNTKGHAVGWLDAKQLADGERYSYLSFLGHRGKMFLHFQTPVCNYYFEQK